MVICVLCIYIINIIDIPLRWQRVSEITGSLGLFASSGSDWVFNGIVAGGALNNRW
jgi:hypothetical protein